MEAKEYTVINKSAWGAGPWVDEPDKAQWADDATGLPCLIVRSLHTTGALCGYVGVPEGHRYYGAKYDDVDVDVHGGLTYAAACRVAGDEAQSVCHVPAPGETDRVWWLGFDCAHAFDLSPNLRDTLRRLMPHEKERYTALFREEYRDWAYVRAEVTRLAAQLKAVGCAIT